MCALSYFQVITIKGDPQAGRSAAWSGNPYTQQHLEEPSHHSPRRQPTDDRSVHLVVTSPPYWQLKD
ncbi:MAG: hypothetical protein JZU70_11355, partial [Chlorobium sp.]|nr:hypothetical protein [Chlorobium sp.]